MEKSKIVIIGIGDVFENQYFDSFSAASQKGLIEVYCADQEALWKGEIREKRLATKEKLLNAGLNFIDVSNPLDLEEFIKDKHFLAIIVATPDKTHIKVAEDWINSTFTIMVIEKPFSDEPVKIDNLYFFGKSKIDQIVGFDHYRGKLHKYFGNTKFQEQLEIDLQAPLKKFRFFCLEDFSGTDKKYLEKNKNNDNVIFEHLNGPIEMVRREETLDSGMCFDLSIHFLAVLAYFGKPATVDVKEIYAGRYVGLGDNSGKIEVDGRLLTTRIRGETYIAFNFDFEQEIDEESSRIVSGEAYFGKGIRGIKNPHYFNLNLDQEILGEVKLIEFESETGRKVQIFLKRDEKDKMKRIIDSHGTVEDESEFVIPNAHDYLLEELLSHGIEQSSLFLTVKEAQSYLNKIEEISSKIQDKDLPFYSLGRRNGKQDIISYPEYLDSIYHRFGPIWKKPKT